MVRHKLARQMDIQPIKTEADYRTALAEVEQLFAVQRGSCPGRSAAMWSAPFRF